MRLPRIARLRSSVHRAAGNGLAGEVDHGVGAIERVPPGRVVRAGRPEDVAVALRPAGEDRRAVAGGAKGPGERGAEKAAAAGNQKGHAGGPVGRAAKFDTAGPSDLLTN